MGPAPEMLISRCLAGSRGDLEGVPDFLEPTLLKFFLPENPLHLRDWTSAISLFLVRPRCRGLSCIVVFGDYEPSTVPTSSALLGCPFFQGGIGGQYSGRLHSRPVGREGLRTQHRGPLLKLKEEARRWSSVHGRMRGPPPYEPWPRRSRRAIDIIVNRPIHQS